jgi:thioredoxin reductase
VIIVGAGIAGIAASILIPRKVANLTYKVFEKQDAVVSIESTPELPVRSNGTIGWYLGAKSLSWREVRYSISQLP